MSDSDCSNCPHDEHCPFFDQSYNCVVRSMIEIQNTISKDEMSKIIQARDILVKANKIIDNDDITMVINPMNELIELYNEVIPPHIKQYCE